MRLQQQVDQKWMEIALTVAKGTQGQTYSNPAVGAVVVKDGQLLGVGAHLAVGTPHAEVHALDMAGDHTVGATLYVTLEPCNHYGRTPPCTEKTIASKVKRVVVGCVDPDPRVAGKGIARLQAAGIDVVEGVSRAACLALNRSYFHHRQTGLPFVTMKSASTLDGKIATSSGDSRWVTGEAAREEVHRLRHLYDAVLIGIGTAVADHPQLTTRLPGGGKNPVRVVVDSQLQLPLDSPLVGDGQAPTWVFCNHKVEAARADALQEKGVRVFRIESEKGVDLYKMMRRLGEEGILSVLTEAGGSLNASLLREGLVDQVKIFLAPKLLGGVASVTAMEGENPVKMSEAVSLKEIQVEYFGEDLCVTGVPMISFQEKGR